MKISNWEDYMDEDEEPIRMKSKGAKKKRIAPKNQSEWEDRFDKRAKPKGKQKRRNNKELE